MSLKSKKININTTAYDAIFLSKSKTINCTKYSLMFILRFNSLQVLTFYM